MRNKKNQKQEEGEVMSEEEDEQQKERKKGDKYGDVKCYMFIWKKQCVHNVYSLYVICVLIMIMNHSQH